MPAGLSAPSAPGPIYPLTRYLFAAKSSSPNGSDLDGVQLGFQPLQVDLAVAGHADCERLDASVGMAKLDDHVLQRVGGSPARDPAAADRRGC